MIYIIAGIVCAVVLGWYFVRLALDKARLERKLHFRRVEDYEREELMREPWPTLSAPASRLRKEK